jgi:hypothetical protein
MKQILFSISLLVLSAGLMFGQVPDKKAVAAEPTAEKAAKTSTAHQTGYTRPDAKTRQKRYVKNMFGPTALAKTVVSAGISTAQNSPEEWGGQWEGFGKRVASGMGKRIIRNTVTYGLDEAFTLDSHFYRSEKRGLGARIGNSFVSVFTARKAGGKRVLGFPRLVGTYTAHVIAAETWYPDRYTYKDGLKSGTVSLGMGVVYNLIREFIRKK